MKPFFHQQHAAHQNYRWRIVLLVLLIGTFIVGCGSAPQKKSVEIPRGGELRWALVGVNEPSNIDPAHVNEQQSIIITNLVFHGLLRLDENLTVQPSGAESWDVSDDGCTYTFHLRNDLRFADGTPVTSDDVLYSFNRVLAPETGAYSAPSFLRHIVGASDVVDGKATQASGVRALDEHTVELELDEPLAYFLSWFTSPNTFIVPRSLIEEHGDTWTDYAVGTGPFRVKQWNHGSDIILEANPYYFAGVPGIERVRLPFVFNSNDAYQQYLDGKLDIMGNYQVGIPAERVSEAHAVPGFHSTVGLVVRYVGFNNKKPPLDNIYVRQAFSLSVDRIELAEVVLKGSVEPTGRILPYGLGNKKYTVKEQTFNPQGARSALQLAGYLSGQELPPVTLTYAIEGDNELVAQTMQIYWHDTLGVNVAIQGLQLAEFSKQLDATYQTPEKGLDMYLSVWGADYPDPQNFISQQLRTGSPNNNGNWSNATFDEQVDQADRMGEQSKQDERFERYRQAEQIALDEVGWLPLYNPRTNIFIHPRVHGLFSTPQDIIAGNWADVRLEPDTTLPLPTP